MLSPRELEILQLVAEGNSQPEIGRRLYIGRWTVKQNMKNVHRKLGSRSSAHAVYIACCRGWLTA